MAPARTTSRRSTRFRVVEIDANHYTITTHDDSIAAIGAFLRTS
jgi:hypothetical protein